MRGADGVKIAVLRKGPDSLVFMWAAAHAHEPKKYNLLTYGQGWPSWKPSLN